MGHVKLYINVLNTFTKKGTRQNMLYFRRDNILYSKTAKIELWNHNINTIMSKSRFIPYIS